MWRIPFILLIAGSLQAQFAFPEESLLLQRFDIFVPTTLYTESFEGAGYENATTETQLGIDEDDTTAATSGSQNLKIASGVASTYCFPTAAFTSSAVVTIDFSFKVNTVGSDNQIIQMNDSPDSTGRGYIWVMGSGVLRIYGNSGGSNFADTTGTVTANTQYYCRATWNKTTGAYQVEFQTTHVFGGTGNNFASGSNGDTGVTIGSIRYDCSFVGYTSYFDQMFITTP